MYIYYLYRGVVKQELQEFQDATADYSKVVELDPYRIDAYLYRGEVKQKLEEFQEAVADFDKVIELDPKHVDAYCRRKIKI